jgi:hypothetical protein
MNPVGSGTFCHIGIGSGFVSGSETKWNYKVLTDTVFQVKNQKMR